MRICIRKLDNKDVKEKKIWEINREYFVLCLTELG